MHLATTDSANVRLWISVPPAVLSGNRVWQVPALPKSLRYVSAAAGCSFLSCQVAVWATSGPMLVEVVTPFCSAATAKHSLLEQMSTDNVMCRACTDGFFRRLQNTFTR